MVAIVTDFFRIKNAKDFVAMAATKPIYTVLGKVSPWADENDPPLPTSSIQTSIFGMWNDAFAAKKILPGDVSHVISRNDWVSGDTTYTAYDPITANLFTRKFYTMTEDSGIFRVYKCIVKGVGATTIKPTFTGAEIPVAGADGYRWKFMYAISPAAYNKFVTQTYIPVSLTASNAASTTTIGATPVPPGGHGANNIDELGAFSVAINTMFLYSENGTIAASNDFRRIGLVVEPLVFNGTAASGLGGSPVTGTVATANVINCAASLTLSANSGSFANDEIITSSSGATAQVVSWVSLGRKLNVHILSGSFAANQTLTGGTSGATGTLQTVAGMGLQKYSGGSIYIENRRPVSRSFDQTESITTVIEF